MILGIHRFMGEAIAVTNLIGNGVAAIVVGRWCGELDAARLAECLRVRIQSPGSSQQSGIC